MKIALSTDHAGYENLKKLENFLTQAGHECLNYGPKVYDEADDYPDFIIPAAKAVASGECEIGIIMGGTGNGEAMAANRVKGARAAVYYGPAKPVGTVDADGRSAEDDFEILRLSKQHNNANILSLGARFMTSEQVEQAVTLWLKVPFSAAERHARRIKKLDEMS